MATDDKKPKDDDAKQMEALGRLTRQTIHDLNSPLASIMGFADFLMNDLPADSEQHVFASNIRQAGIQLQDIIDRLEQFSKKS